MTQNPVIPDLPRQRYTFLNQFLRPFMLRLPQGHDSQPHQHPNAVHLVIQLAAECQPPLPEFRRAGIVALSPGETCGSADARGT